VVRDRASAAAVGAAAMAIAARGPAAAAVVSVVATAILPAPALPLALDAALAARPAAGAHRVGRAHVPAALAGRRTAMATVAGSAVLGKARAKGRVLLRPCAILAR
jgi:hypothetical protein